MHWSLKSVGIVCLSDHASPRGRCHYLLIKTGGSQSASYIYIGEVCSVPVELMSPLDEFY